MRQPAMSMRQPALEKAAAAECLLIRCMAIAKAVVLQLWSALILQPNMQQALRPCSYHYFRGWRNEC